MNNRRMLILAEGRFGPLTAKTATGAIAFCRDEVVGVIDSVAAGSTAQQILGYGGPIPVVASLEEGIRLNPAALLIGIAPPGGRLPDSWRPVIREAIQKKLNIISGLHTMLGDDDEFVSLARSTGVTLTDLRTVPDSHRVVARGSWRTRRARTVLTIGTDCKIGKMTTILEVEKAFRRPGRKCAVVATGQTGILILGRGVPVDAVIGDYIAGSVETEINIVEAEGADVIFVEGQGALTHQGYSSVTLGLMHGTMPDAMILVHQPTRERDDYGFRFPPLPEVVRLHEQVVGYFKPTKVVAIGLNSVGLNDGESMAAAARIERETGLPTIDAFRFGGEKLATAVAGYFG